MHFKREPDGSEVEAHSLPSNLGEPFRCVAYLRSFSHAWHSWWPSVRPRVRPASSGGGQPPIVEFVGSWTMTNDEERFVRIDPGPEVPGLLEEPMVRTSTFGLNLGHRITR
jgi:hypothetical protein